MGNVLLDVSMSLDGFIAGPDVRLDMPMGRGGEQLHDWMFNGATGPANEADVAVKQDLMARIGAVVVGRRTFDVGIGPWGDTPFPVPCFVLTHRGRDELVMDSGTFTFVTDGVESALRQATAAAGDKDVVLMGADVAQQFLSKGLLDVMHIHLVPVLLGAGRRLFDRLDVAPAEHVEFEQTAMIQSPYVTHLRFRCRRG